MLAGLLTCVLIGCGDSATTGSSTTDTTMAENTTQTEASDEGSDGALQSDSGSTAEEQPASCSLAELYNKICSEVELVSPMELPQEYIENYYAIDLTKLEEYVFSIAEESTSAETIVLMKLKDAADTDSIVEGIKLVVDEKKGEMENYLPEQYDLVARSTIQTKGSYVFLVISANDKEINQIITDTIK